MKASKKNAGGAVGSVAPSADDVVKHYFAELGRRSWLAGMTPARHAALMKNVKRMNQLKRQRRVQSVKNGAGAGGGVGKASKKSGRRVE